MQRLGDIFRAHILPNLFWGLAATFFLITLLGPERGWFATLISLPLIFFYPGYFLSRIWKKSLPAATRFSLSVVFSFTLHIALLSIFKDSIALTPTELSIYLLLVNLALAILYQFLFRRTAKPDTAPYIWLDYLILAIPLIFFGLNFALSPLISEGDSYYFIYAAIDSFRAGYDVSPYVNRPGFIPFLGLLHQAGGESFVLIFRLLLPLLFYASLVMVLDYIQKYSTNYGFTRWLFLLFIAAPVVTTEVDIARTQSIVFALTVPVLLLLSHFLQSRRISYLAIAAILSLSGTRIHELAYVLLLTTLFTAVIYGIQTVARIPSRKQAIITSVKWLVIALVVLYPYYLLLKADPSFTFIQNSASAILHNLVGFNWEWWFLNNYTADGHQLGWQGKEALLFYLYNGMLVALTFIFFAAITKKKISWTLISPFLFFTFVYVAVAEILPRIGLFYYPNRAWPHLMIGFVLVFIGMALNFSWRFRGAHKLMIFALVFLIFSGVSGWVKLTYDKGGFYVKEEIRIRNFIRDQLPDNAIIYTTQPSNQAIIHVYGNKQTASISPSTLFTNYESFLSDLLRTQQQESAERNTAYPYLKRTRIESKDGQALSQEVEILPPTTITLPEPTSPEGPLYFYYSFARFNGYMGHREWWKTVNNYQNYQFFQKFPAVYTVYRDNAGLIVKLK